jgi:HNH endonuclease
MPRNCILWEGGKSGKYGIRRWKGKPTGAHRAAWMEANKAEIPAGMVVMHTCDNTLCVNPEHLRLGTTQDNLEDCRQKGRNAVPTSTRFITPEKVKELRVLYGLGWGLLRLMKEFGLSRAATYDAAVGNTWRQV